MKGDFSRYRFDPAKHYAAVLEQQGRVQLDADANEQRAIEAHRLLTQTVDVVGATGAPRHAAGFAVSLNADNTSLLIGPGRYYVDGLLCEAATQTDYAQQPFLIGPQPTIDVVLGDLRAGRASAIRVWLEVWQRLATPIDDPCLKDPALGEADTTVRLQTVWRVVAEEVPPAASNVSGLTGALQDLRQSIATFQLATHSPALSTLAAQADVLAQEAAAGRLAQTRLAAAVAALHTSAVSAVSQLRVVPAVAAAQLTTSVNALAQSAGTVLREDCCTAMRRLPLFLMPGEMTATAGGMTDLGPCLPSPQAAYRGLENQLYRIEVHQGGPLAQATFKWSRDNGSVLARIINVSGKVLTVDTLGPDANLGFAPLQWVEISDDSDDFGQVPNRPGALRQIQTVQFEHNTITLTDVAPAVDTQNGHAKLRRWDHADATATELGIPMAPGGAHQLENGIEVQFSDARPFRSGDFWLVPARTATGQLEWPPCGSDGAAYQPARNIVVHRAPLACIELEGRPLLPVVHDCRAFFSPLVELAPPAAQTAMHVTAINWRNDDVQTLDQLLSNGLSVTLDTPPAAPIDPARFSLTLEYPLSLDQFSRAEVAGERSFSVGLLRTDLIIDGTVGVQGSAVNWSLPANVYFYLAQTLESLDGLASRQQYVRARVRLRGDTVWAAAAGPAAYLDGQCFGTAALRADGKTPRTDLTFPSGASQPASDFESWFDLAPLPRVASLTVTPAAVAWVPVPGSPFLLRLVDAATQQPTTPSLTLALNYAAVADTQVAIAVSGGTPGNVVAPSPVTVPRAATAPAQTVALSVGNPGAKTDTYTLTAQVVLASGNVFPVQASFTVTGHVSPIVIGRPPFSPTLPGGAA